MLDEPFDFLFNICDVNVLVWNIPKVVQFSASLHKCMWLISGAWIGAKILEYTGQIRRMV